MMDTLEAIRTRRSVRAFASQPVPREVVAELLEVSCWAPSARNRQNWRVTVADGPLAAALGARLAERTRARLADTPDSGPGEALPPGSRDLYAQFDTAAAATGTTVRELVTVGSNALYSAPTVIVVTAPGGGSGDADLFVTTLLLAAHAMGLGACWLGYPLAHADLIREMLDIPEGERPAAVVALSYPDEEAPVNRIRTGRLPMEEFARWANAAG
jgi:nitroreductase